MGGAVSTNISDVITKSIMEVAVEQGASTTGNISGSINIKGSVISGSKITMDLQLIQNSMTKMTVNNDIINQIMNKIKQNAKSESQILGAAVSTNSTKLESSIRQCLTTSMVHKCAGSVGGEINVTDSKVYNSEVSQRIQSIQKCLFNSMNSNQLFNKTVNDIQQTATSKYVIFGMGFLMVIIALIVGGVLLSSSYGNIQDKLQNNNG